MKHLLLCGLLFLLVISAQAAVVTNSLTIFDNFGTITNQVNLYDDNSMSCVGACGRMVFVGEVLFFSDSSLTNPALFGGGLYTQIQNSDNTWDIIGLISIGSGVGPSIPGLSMNIGLATPLLGRNVIADPSGLFDATQYLAPLLQAQGYTVQYARLAAGASSSPEPCTLVLLGGGLVLLWVGRGHKTT